MAQKTRTIIVKVNDEASKTLRDIAKSFDLIEKNTKSTSKSVESFEKSFGRLKNTLVSIAGISFLGVGFREFFEASDEIQRLNDRLKIVSGSTEAASATFEKLQNLAVSLKSPLSSVAEGYTRIASATSRLNLSQDATLGIVTALTNSFRASGSSTQEALGATRQFTQALSAGALRGEELNAILEGNAVLAQAFTKRAAEANKSVKDFASEGGFSLKVILEVLAENFDQINSKADKLSLTVGDALTLSFDKLKVAMFEFNKQSGVGTGFIQFLQNITDLTVLAIKQISSLISTISKAFSAIPDKFLPGPLALLKTLSTRSVFQEESRLPSQANGADNLKKALEEAAKNAKPLFKTLDQQIGDLTVAFNKGSISVEDFNKKLTALEIKRLDEKLKKGQLSLRDYDKEIKKLNFESLSRSFEAGALSLEDYNQAIQNLKIDELNQKFKDGKILVADYHREIIALSEEFLPGSALSVGIEDYLKRSGKLAQNIAGLITNTFFRLEDTLLDFIKTGTFEFAKFTQAVLDDLTRIILRAAILQPIAGGILNFAGLQAPVAQEKGGAWNQGTQFFAKGGVVSSPMAFRHSYGTGVMGEAGPEAILPLKRGSSGELGVQASSGSKMIVNVINQTGGEVEQRESVTPSGDRVLDLIITSKVKEAFGAGYLDKTMASLYGVRRKGA